MMALKKKSFTKLAMIGVFAVVVLGLAGCNDSDESEQAGAFGVEDLPTWVRAMTTDEDWEAHFDSLTPEELELFFTEGLGAMSEPPAAPEDSGHQMQIAVPGQGGDCNGGLMRMDGNGMECVDLEDLLDSEDLDEETRQRIKEALDNQD